MSFFAEIKRRKVFQVTAVYAVVCWLIIQVIDVVGEPLSLPGWLDTVVIVLLASGFPIALVLAWAFELTPQGIRAASGVQGSVASPQARGQKFTYVTHGLVLLAVGFLVLNQYGFVPGASRGSDLAAPPRLGLLSNVKRWEIPLGATEPVGDTPFRAHVALSPDGRQLVYAAQVGGRTQLYLRATDQIQARPMEGTDGALFPTFSPDGQWVVFFDEADGKLERVSVRGGVPQALADITDISSGASWLDDDVIIFGSGDVAGGRKLFRIPANGGTAEPLLEPEPETGHGRPHVLPGGNAVLFQIRPGSGGSGPARDGQVAVLSLETGEIRTLIEQAHTPRYASSGHILFARAGDLWAVPFDAEELAVTGREVPVIDGVEQNGDFGGAVYAISNDGLLIYGPGTDVTGENIVSLVWVDRDGREEPLDAEPRAYSHMNLSPDGRRLAVRINEGGNEDIWVLDISRGTPIRLTLSPGNEISPLWTADSERVVFGSRDTGGLHWRVADGTEQAQRLLTGDTDLWPMFVSPESDQLFYLQFGELDWDIHVLSLQGEASSHPFLELEGAQIFASLSPDGRWLAYASDETGRLEIHVQSFPDLQDKWTVSRNGGVDPVWGPDGSELFFRTADALMAVNIETDPTFSFDSPRVLFRQNEYLWGNFRSYAASLDGQRFLMSKIAEPADRTGLIVVDNWFEELARLAPSAQ